MHSSESSHSGQPILGGIVDGGELYGRLQIAILGGIVLTMPLVDTWTRPIGPVKVVEILAAVLLISVVVSNRTINIDLTPAGRALLAYLLISIVSFLAFYALNYPESVPPAVPWASGMRTPPLYNVFKIAQQILFISLFLLVANIRRLQTVLFLLRIHVLAATAASLFGITQFVAHYLVGSEFGISMWFLPRVSSVFPEPGPFGTYLLTSIFLLVVLLMKRNDRLFRTPVVAGLLGIQLLAELLTFSGRGWIGFAVVSGLLLFTELDLKQRLQFLAGSVVGLIGLLSIDRLAQPLVYLFTTKLQVFLTANRSAAESGGRIAGLYIAPHMFRQNPLLGIGTGNYPVLRNRIKPDWVPIVSFLDLPANHYLQILAENGILGFMAFAFGMVQLIRSVWNGRRHVDSEIRPVLTGTIFASFAMLVALLVSSVLWFAHFWVPLGLAYAILRVGKVQ